MARILLKVLGGMKNYFCENRSYKTVPHIDLRSIFILLILHRNPKTEMFYVKI